MNYVQGHADATSWVLQGGLGSHPRRAGSPTCAQQVSPPRAVGGILVSRVHTECGKRFEDGVRSPDSQTWGVCRADSHNLPSSAATCCLAWRGLRLYKTAFYLRTHGLDTSLSSLLQSLLNHSSAWAWIRAVCPGPGLVPITHAALTTQHHPALPRPLRAQHWNEGRLPGKGQSRQD